ncbi:MAG TPA: hypothetical protein VIL07_10355, partial [Symbiobacteriaceae bacterium]
LSGVRVLGEREVEIDHLLLGPNGFWAIDASSGPVQGRSRSWLRWPWHRSRRTDGNGNDGDESVRNLRAFLQRYLGNLVDQISFHRLACRWEDHQLVWAQKAGEFRRLTPAEVRAEIVGAPGANPLPPEVCSRIMILLLRETVDRTRRHLEEQNVPDPLPRLEPTKYEHLGLSVLASDEEIDRRFAELSRQYQPNGGLNGCDGSFDQIRTVYRELRENRGAYEQWLWREAQSTLRAMREIAEKFGG